MFLSLLETVRDVDFEFSVPDRVLDSGWSAGRAAAARAVRREIALDREPIELVDMGAISCVCLRWCCGVVWCVCGVVGCGLVSVFVVCGVYVCVVSCVPCVRDPTCGVHRACHHFFALTFMCCDLTQNHSALPPDFSSWQRACGGRTGEAKKTEKEVRDLS